MLAVTVKLGSGALFGVGSWLIMACAAIAIILWRINAAWIVAGSAFAGWLFPLLVTFSAIRSLPY